MNRLACLFFLCCLVSNAFAEQCPILRVAADKSWPPYSRSVGTGFVGVGPRIINVAFNELGIPIVFTPIHLAVSQVGRVKFQGVDLVLATYKRSDWLDELQFIEPAYAKDLLAVAVRRDYFPAVSSAEVTGKFDAKVLDFQINEPSVNDKKPYLFVRQESSSHDLARFIHDKKYHYAVGSRAQLSYVSRDLGVASQVTLLSDSVGEDDVFLAFVKDSPCTPYAAYLKQRLNKWHADGTLAEWLEEMRAKALPPVSKPLEALG